MDKKTGCMICGKELVYSDEPENMACYYCNEVHLTAVKCAGGHYVCDRCHSLSANELIMQFCSTTELEDPLEMAEIIMRNPAVKMHGPEHHFLVPAVLLAAYYNRKGDPETKKEKLRQALIRSEQVKGGFCGSHGVCGAAVGTGIFVSLITGSTPLKGKEWSMSNRMTATSLNAIADAGGPRCCKRDSFLAIIEAVKYLKEDFRVSLPMKSDLKCEFSAVNRECRMKGCRFYGGMGFG